MGGSVTVSSRAQFNRGAVCVTPGIQVLLKAETCVQVDQLSRDLAFTSTAWVTGDETGEGAASPRTCSPSSREPWGGLQREQFGEKWGHGVVFGE